MVFHGWLCLQTYFLQGFVFPMSNVWLRSVSGTMWRCQKTWHNAMCVSLGFSCKGIQEGWAAGALMGGERNAALYRLCGVWGPPTSLSSSLACPGCFSHSPASWNVGGKRRPPFKMESPGPIRWWEPQKHIKSGGRSMQLPTCHY